MFSENVLKSSLGGGRGAFCYSKFAFNILVLVLFSCICPLRRGTFQAFHFFKIFCKILFSKKKSSKVPSRGAFGYSKFAFNILVLGYFLVFVHYGVALFKLFISSKYFKAFSFQNIVLQKFPAGGIVLFEFYFKDALLNSIFLIFDVSFVPSLCVGLQKRRSDGSGQPMATKPS